MNHPSEAFCGVFLGVQRIVHGECGGQVREYDGEPEIGQQRDAVGVIGLVAGGRVEDCEDHEDGHQAELEGFARLGEEERQEEGEQEDRLAVGKPEKEVQSEARLKGDEEHGHEEGGQEAKRLLDKPNCRQAR